MTNMNRPDFLKKEVSNSCLMEGNARCLPRAIPAIVLALMAFTVLAGEEASLPTAAKRGTFKYTKSIEIIGAPTWPADQKDYQIDFVCHKDSGADSGKNIHLGAGVRNDFGDLRFRIASGEELSYWMERCEPGKQALFWVKVPMIPKGRPVVIELSYGNPNVVNASNGKATFRFFDDFLGDYQGKDNEHAPKGWELSLKPGDCDWIVKDGVIRFRGDGHLTTIQKVWPSPREECYTLRAAVQWPTPAFANPGENGESFGGVSCIKTDGNAWMDIFALYQRPANSKIEASFGANPNPTPEQASLGAQNGMNFEEKQFQRVENTARYTFEMERQSDATIARIIETGEEIRSGKVVPDEMSLMIHGCHFGFTNSPYLSIDWMLLRKQAYPNPTYGRIIDKK